MDFSFDFVWERSPEQVAGRIISPDVRLFAANEAKRFMDPYVPADTLALAQNTSVYVQGDEGVVEYHSPYAHYQYVGQVDGPNYPIKDGGFVTGWYSPPHKTPTGRSLNYSHFRHPLATSKWDKAMETARKGDLAQAVENYIKR